MPGISDLGSGPGGDLRGSNIPMEVLTGLDLRGSNIPMEGTGGIAGRQLWGDFLQAAGDGVDLGLAGVNLINFYNDISSGNFANAGESGIGYVSSALTGAGSLAGSNILPGAGNLLAAGFDLHKFYNDIGSGNWLSAVESGTAYGSEALMGAGLITKALTGTTALSSAGLVSLVGLGSYKGTSWLLENTDFGKRFMDFIDRKLIIPLSGADTNTGPPDYANAFGGITQQPTIKKTSSFCDEGAEGLLGVLKSGICKIFS